jgi:hypothetical protein
MTNPYTPGELPRDLAGRAPQQERIRSVLDRVANEGEMGGPVLVFRGPRGIGKTSLLRDAQDEAEEHGFVTAWVTCLRGTRFLPDLVSRITRALERAGVVDRGDQSRWTLRLRRLGVEVGVPVGVKVTAAASAESRPDEPDAALAPRVSALEDLLHETSNAIRDRGGAGLVVFLDEVHAADGEDAAVLLSAVENLAGEREDNPLAVVTAGLPGAVRSLIRASTYGEGCAFVTIPPLSPGAARSAVLAPAAELGVGWSPGALERIVIHAQGYPSFLQVLAHESWDAAAPVRGETLDEDAVTVGLARALDQFDTVFAACWDAASVLERQIISALADSPKPALSRHEIAAGLGRPAEALGVPRDRLLEQGVIETVGRDRMRLTLPGFDDYVRQRRDGGASAQVVPPASGDEQGHG